LFSLRKVKDSVFQYHIRLHNDREIRAHYEYSSEGNPVGHIFEKVFEEQRDYFTQILKEYLE
jgi:hypothetical protein